MYSTCTVYMYSTCIVYMYTYTPVHVHTLYMYVMCTLVLGQLYIYNACTCTCMKFLMFDLHKLAWYGRRQCVSFINTITCMHINTYRSMYIHVFPV